MNFKLLLFASLLTSSASFAHQLSTASIKYSIEQNLNSNGVAAYDITYGIVQYIDPNGSIKRCRNAHMARIAPTSAQQIFGKITVDVANELAGTWYIYK